MPASLTTRAQRPISERMNAVNSSRLVGAMSSAIPDRFTVPAGPLGGAEGITLPVPQFSVCRTSSA